MCNTDKTVLSCLVWRCEWSRPTVTQVRSVSGLCRSVSGGAVRPPDALRRRTHLSGGNFTPPHQTRQDCRACLSTAATQARQAAAPSPPTAHTQRRCTPLIVNRTVLSCVASGVNWALKWRSPNKNFNKKSSRKSWRVTLDEDQIFTMWTPLQQLQKHKAPSTR